MAGDGAVMRWKAVVSALEAHEQFRSRVSAYQHPLAGRPIVWHVVRALLDTTPQPDSILVLHRAGSPVSIGPEEPRVDYVAVAAGDESRALRAAVTSPGLTVLVDGAAALITASTLARLLRAGEVGVASLTAPEREHEPHVAVAGEGPALASAEDPRHPRGAARVVATDAWETLRVVDRRSLSDASVAIRDRLVRRHETAGVTFLLPATSWIDVDVRIGADTVIEPSTFLRGATTVGERCTVGPLTTAIDAALGDEVSVVHSYLNGCEVRAGATVGPFAYLRPGALLREKSKAGTFVEIKNSDIGEGTKVPHLSYVGDADVGPGTNLGAATITANYDGRNKHRTTIGANVRTSVDTTLVAPVTVGDDAYTGAGSVVTDDVPAGALAIARARQTNIDDYAERRRKSDPQPS